MVKTLKYVSASNEVIDLTQFNTRIVTGSFHSYKWEYDATEMQYGVKLNKFRKDALKLDITIACRSGDKGSILNHLTDVTEKDIVNETMGKLYWEDWYVEGFMLESETAPSDKLFGAERKWVFVAPYPFWIKANKKEFMPHTVTGGTFLDYDYDYAYDYSYNENGFATWNIDHYAPSDFEAVIYGYVEEPRFVINGHQYEIFDTLNNGEYIVINSKENTIFKYLTDGSSQNIFDLRNKTDSVFEKIPSGYNTVTWNGTFGFTITAFVERSEPKWR